MQVITIATNKSDRTQSISCFVGLTTDRTVLRIQKRLRLHAMMWCENTWCEHKDRVHVGEVTFQALPSGAGLAFLTFVPNTLHHYTSYLPLQQLAYHTHGSVDLQMLLSKPMSYTARR